ncbi:MAG TPA: ISH6 family transposase, partial [Candidatus Methanoperedens sp.]|nr:ISH6 family transposase [Candidatus Methanoperedens sp.]
GTEIKSVKAVTEKTVYCGDAEKEMKNAMTEDADSYQLDLIHAARIAGFKLWEDKIMSLEERNRIVSKLEGVLYTLKNSVEKHLIDKNTDDLKNRINMTVDDLKKMSKELWKLGCRKTATFIKKYSNSMVVFAKFAMNGIRVPWNSNIIERLMGEISKRTKHKWMKWTTKGLETILNIILVRYCSEENYEEFKNRIIMSENLIFIMAEVKICSFRGEF